MLHHHPHSGNTAELWPGAQIKISIEKKPSVVVCDRPMSGKLWAKEKISPSKLGVLTKHKMSPLDIASRAKGGIVKSIGSKAPIASSSSDGQSTRTVLIPFAFLRSSRERQG